LASNKRTAPYRGTIGTRIGNWSSDALQPKGPAVPRL
jgi:hypothetical protein